LYFIVFELVMWKITLILAIALLSKVTNQASFSKCTENSHSLPLIGIRINGGAKFTNDPKIKVEIKSLKTEKSLIEAMKIGLEADLSSANWQPYTEEAIELTLTGEDGEKRVFVQLKDKAGNTSPIESNKIIFDTIAPDSGGIMINKGEKYTNDKLGRVLVNVRAEGAHEVMISNSERFQNARWEPYKESIKWVIDVGGGDGQKLVYAKFRDEADNESNPVNASIMLDVTPPSDGSLVINSGDKYTRSRQLKLLVISSDATKVRIVSRGVGKNFDFEPENNGRMELIWETDSIQGPKSVKAYFMDEAKNTTKIPAVASIILKTNPPTKALVTIDQGQKFTKHADGVVSVTLSAKENPHQLRMLISNKPNFEGAKERSFNTNIGNWKLESEEDGLKTVYVRLIDEAGNISEVSKAEIFLDRTPPSITSFSINNGKEWATSLQITLTSEVNDAFEAKYSNNSSTLRNIRWEKYNPTRPDWTLLPNDGDKTVFAIFRDQAGNVTEVVSTSIKLDMTPPNGKLIVNGGMKVTNHPEGMVKLQIEHDADVIGMQITNLPKFDGLQLLPLEKTIENWKIDETQEGLKTIFARLQDKAGNFSKVLTASILFDRTPPTDCELVINNNEEYIRNKNKKVSLSLRAEGANAMLISNIESFAGAEWIPFKTAIGWTLEGPEGIHYVHAKFKDAAGNESGIISESIKSDFAPPKIIKFAINDGAEYCADPQGNVNLTFEVEDALQMAISNTQLNDTGSIRSIWEPYQNSKTWKLDGEDGLKMVYGRFMDAAGNVTHEYYDKIVLDRIPPTDAKISINNGAPWFSNKDGKGNIMLYAKGASNVMISNNAEFSQASWEAMTEIRKDWPIDISRTEATVYAKFKDKAGNVSEPVSASIKVDVEPPSNLTVNIDEGAKYVKSSDRKISISIGAEGATGMRISQYKDFRNTKWEPFATKKEIVFTEPDGEKSFFLQCSDDAGNESEIISSSIILDTTPPKINAFSIDNGEEWTNHSEKKVSLTIDASGAQEMMIGHNPDFSGATWEPYKSGLSDYILPGEDGEKILFLKLRDEPGNVSRVVTAKINLKRSF